MTPEAEIQLVSYDESWPTRFRLERALLDRVLEGWLVGTIEHVGSTAVPGLLAKPVIDIMAGVASLEASRSAITALGGAGYRYAPYRPDVMHWLCKPDVSFRTHHLHLVPFESELWIERVAFRDYLRSHAAVAAEYAALKTELAHKHRLDREAYTLAKGPFVASVVRSALAVRSGPEG